MDTVTHGVSGALVGSAVANYTGVLPDQTLQYIVIGALAGSLPDIDFLAELKGKLAAWRLHRILLHGVTTAFLLGMLFIVVATLIFDVSWQVISVITVTALCVHLILDVLTSFGTCLLYPFSRKRFSLKLNFISDPFVLGICIWGLVVDTRAIEALFSLCLYFVFCVGVKRLTEIQVRKNLPSGFEKEIIFLEPALLAPFRWLAIVKIQQGYLHSQLNFLSLSDWCFTPHGMNPKLVSLAEKDPLLSAVLATFEFPVYQVYDKELLVIEDLKWWTERPFRPLAFTATIVNNGDKLSLQDEALLLADVQQGGYFVMEGRDKPYLQPALPYASNAT